MNRRMKKKLSLTSNPECKATESIEVVTEFSQVMPSKVDQECQVDFYSRSDVQSQTFICNRFVKDDMCHAETQTEILEDTRPIKIYCGNNNKKFANKECGTPHKTFVDTESQTDNKHGFHGFASVTKDREILDLAGVSFPNFDFLLTKIRPPRKCIVSKKDRLLIFLMKIKTGLTFSGLGVLSDVAGGRKSDSQLTIESGLLDLLEDGDIVLADKGFPEIKTVIDASGKKVKMVMPPFLEKKTEFSKEETQQTYSVARVRIHVERIMQRLRTHQILHKIPQHLFHCIDDILHICCVLVNLQPPIISNKTDEANEG
ncbi:uncharacterized protein LOC123301317 [Chrysoperla carnea]|uniref:uncharacterized protein LOC123301317 n=1 Tax=Chrysoperla carnea TaxID=189513 RepID=UPI001D05DB28|nr:uncharacterized protein LOC123301317 [Chrysoperla carnea]